MWPISSIWDSVSQRGAVCRKFNPKSIWDRVNNIACQSTSSISPARPCYAAHVNHWATRRGTDSMQHARVPVSMSAREHGLL